MSISGQPPILPISKLGVLMFGVSQVSFGLAENWGKQLPPLKLTWNLKMKPCKRRFLLETIIFWCYVSFREGSWHSYCMLTFLMIYLVVERFTYFQIFAPNKNPPFCAYSSNGRFNLQPTGWGFASRVRFLSGRLGPTSTTLKQNMEKTGDQNKPVTWTMSHAGWLIWDPYID